VSPDWEITIVDENVETLPLAPAGDLIGVCGMGMQFPRQAELRRFYRSRGYYVAAGGSYASLCPEQYAGLANAVVAGEAERGRGSARTSPRVRRRRCTGRPRRSRSPTVDLDERLRSVVSFDWSVFHLVLSGTAQGAPRA
jgi:hypothetical protein